VPSSSEYDAKMILPASILISTYLVALEFGIGFGGSFDWIVDHTKVELVTVDRPLDRSVAFSM